MDHEINYIPSSAKKMLEESGVCSRSRAAPGSQSDTPEADILHDHCHIDNTPAPEAIETWVEKCQKLERERNRYKAALDECWQLIDEAEKDEINIRDEMEKWQREYGHLLSENSKIGGCEPSSND